jgi:hypothetical protein
MARTEIVVEQNIANTFATFSLKNFRVFAFLCNTIFPAAVNRKVRQIFLFLICFYQLKYTNFIDF